MHTYCAWTPMSPPLELDCTRLGKPPVFGKLSAAQGEDLLGRLSSADLLEALQRRRFGLQCTRAWA